MIEPFRGDNIPYQALNFVYLAVSNRLVDRDEGLRSSMDE